MRVYALRCVVQDPGGTPGAWVVLIGPWTRNVETAITEFVACLEKVGLTREVLMSVACVSADHENLNRSASIRGHRMVRLKDLWWRLVQAGVVGVVLDERLWPTHEIQ